VEIGRRRPDAV
jgi:hypothetical protein